jgi:hypothetical protein
MPLEDSAIRGTLCQAADENRHPACPACQGGGGALWLPRVSVSVWLSDSMSFLGIWFHWAELDVWRTQRGDGDTAHALPATRRSRSWTDRCP